MQKSLINSREDFHRILACAIDRTRQLTETCRTFTLLQVIGAQLDFMRSLTIADGPISEQDRNRVDVGVIAVRNFEDSDPEFADWLKELNYAFRRWENLKHSFESSPNPVTQTDPEAPRSPGINPLDGVITLEEPPLRIGPGLTRSEFLNADDLAKGNGAERVQSEAAKWHRNQPRYTRELDGQHQLMSVPFEVKLCFDGERLAELSLRHDDSGLAATREQWGGIAAQRRAFFDARLSEFLGTERSFAWGAVWSAWDPHGDPEFTIRISYNNLTGKERNQLEAVQGYPKAAEQGHAAANAVLDQVAPPRELQSGGALPNLEQNTPPALPPPLLSPWRESVLNIILKFCLPVLSLLMVLFGILITVLCLIRREAIGVAIFVDGLFAFILLFTWGAVLPRVRPKLDKNIPADLPPPPRRIRWRRRPIEKLLWNLACLAMTLLLAAAGIGITLEIPIRLIESASGAPNAAVLNWDNLKGVLSIDFFAACGVFILLRRTALERRLVRYGTSASGTLTSRRAYKSPYPTAFPSFHLSFKFKTSQGMELTQEINVALSVYRSAQIGAAATVLYDPDRPARSVVHEYCKYYEVVPARAGLPTPVVDKSQPGNPNVMQTVAAAMSDSTKSDSSSQRCPDMRDTLFGDMPIDAVSPPSEEAESLEPLLSFADARNALAAGRKSEAIDSWRRITAMEGLESRRYLQAWHFLRGQGVKPPENQPKELLGVVVEVPMEDGLDLLAAYADHTARFWSYSGSGVIWEHPAKLLDPLIDALLDAGNTILQEIGSWDGPRPPAPPQGQVRLNLLSPSGLHFAQGTFDQLTADPKGKIAVAAAIALMQKMGALRSK
jgi:hypothetical protein